MHYLLKTENLAKRYPQFALEHIDLQIEPGYVTGLIGANGAGKTTIIKSVLGLIRPSDGHVSLFDEQVDDDERKLGQALSKIGVVYDTCSFPNEMFVGDIASIGKISFTTWDDAYFSRLLDEFSLDPKKRVKELSRGMGMKLMLAFALAHHPQLLILDEPTAGLDPIARDETLNILRDFMSDEQKGILISSHITSDLEKIADHIVCIDQGKTVFSTPKDEICGISGIARCSEEELSQILDSGYFEQGTAHFIRHGYSTDLLVPDRFEFKKRLAGVVCDPADIDSYMTLILKGEMR